MHLTDVRPASRTTVLHLGPSSFDDLYAAMHESLLRFFMRQTLDAEASVDLVAETFAQAFTARRRFRGNTREEEEAYLYGIARNLLTGFIRRGYVERRALRRLGVERIELDDARIDQMERAAGIEHLRLAVRREVSQLSPDHRQALELRIVDERPYAEVADLMGVTEQTARARVSRALKALAERLPELNLHEEQTI